MIHDNYYCKNKLTTIGQIIPNQFPYQLKSLENLNLNRKFDDLQFDPCKYCYQAFERK